MRGRTTLGAAVRPFALPSCWVAGAAPLLLFALLLTLAAHLRIALGRWPQPMVESFTSGALGVHVAVVQHAWFAVPLALPVALALSALSGPQRLRRGLSVTALFAAGCALLLVCAYTDPTPFTDWLLD